MRELISVLVSSLILSGALQAEEWVTQSGRVGTETFSVAFPSEPESKDKPQEMTLFSRDGAKALYILAVSNPPLVRSPAVAVEKFLRHHNTPPKSVVSHSVTEKEGNTLLDIDSFNSKNHVRTKIRYVITPNNIWELKTVFDHENEQDHSAFARSFELN